MNQEILINVTGKETRVALLEGGLPVEFYLERQGSGSIVGNVYKGKVVRVLPGIQAAFVDIGLEKAGFLYVSDFFELPEEEGADELELIEEGEGDLEPEAQPLQEARATQGKPKIQDLLKEGQEIPVQVTKEPLGTKGARLTSKITLPGKFLVYMPTVNHVGISRRLGDEAERQRLRDILHAIRPAGGGGLIARTASDGAKEEELRQDMEFLMNLWKVLLEQKDKRPAPSLLLEDLRLELRTIRDLVGPDVERIIVDHKKTYENVLTFIETTLPHIPFPPLVYYDGTQPLFEVRGIEARLKEGLKRKVRLKSGGSIVIDEAEALTAIDVNTGGFVGSHNLEDTVLKTNLEAIKEIVYQLRLRNLGGIIILDFIDMERETNREKVFSALKDALKVDRARTTILKISELGLVEMTRKRTRESFLSMMSVPCPHCRGNGYIKSPSVILYEALRALKKEALRTPYAKVVLALSEELAKLLEQEERGVLEEIERLSQKRVAVKVLSRPPEEGYEVTSL
jgi:ribonuclease G